MQTWSNWLAPIQFLKHIESFGMPGLAGSIDKVQRRQCQSAATFFARFRIGNMLFSQTGRVWLETDVCNANAGAEMRAAKTKYEKLFSVYEDFTTAIADINDPCVMTLCSSWKVAKSAYGQARQTGIPESQLASGMEQGLRELPMLFAEVADGKRAVVSKSLQSSVITNFPEFIKQDASRLAAIIGRSNIRNEREYYLVRHLIDALEGEADTLDELSLLYKLVDRFDR